MKYLRLMLLAGLSFLLSTCQSKTSTITILDGDLVVSISTASTVPAEILANANITLGQNDRLLYLGSSIPLEQALPEAKTYTITVRRAVAVTVVTSDGVQTFQSSALTVGQALAEAGYTLYAADRFDPPADTPIREPLTITYHPSHEINIAVDGIQVSARSAAETVGQALAEAGIPLVGLDISVPVESARLPEDGQIRVIRVVESVDIIQKVIPFSTRTELSSDLEIDQQALLQGGEPGLAITRMRTRSEDGVQVSQQSESETIVRPPQDRIMGIGTKIVIRTATLDGVTIEYWRSLRLFATSYSPCRSATPDGRCSYGTSSGMPVQKGVVAMQYDWYILFGFEHLFVPGYGAAVVGDVGGGYLGSHYWIDLGYTDSDYVGWGEWVTVYFLTPVPANPGYVLP
jgi:uncharacterized protein YabE (DUF348 family)